MTARAAVEAFLYREAKLLAARRYDDWVALFTDAGLHSVPAGINTGVQRSAMLIHDDRRRLTERVARTQSPAVRAQRSPTGTTPPVSNVLSTRAGGGAAKGMAAGHRHAAP